MMLRGRNLVLADAFSWVGARTFRKRLMPAYTRLVSLTAMPISAYNGHLHAILF